MRMQRTRHLAASFGALLSACVLPVVASATGASNSGPSPFVARQRDHYSLTRACRADIRSQSGMEYVIGPVRVSMPYSTARAIARRIGVNAAGKPTPASGVPCNVGKNVAERSLSFKESTGGRPHFQH